MEALKAGDKAPDFQGKDQKGNLIKQSDFSGKKLILYFYPKDNTPGCTAEACDFRDNYEMWLSKGYAVVGVSADSEASHEKFAEKHELPFPLIADEDKSIIQAYGVWGEKNLYGKKSMGIKRTTFVIDEKGVITKVFKQVKSKTHTDQILEKINL
ncbi:MAG: thioredoxin-dependent thiol peroxidase [Bacteroidales bacterium]|jgi:peroxiredoxin Q/BCP|nr:thioredoxin-dependent thiol peroxidase [Bacteroidales bacterium]